MAGLQGRILSVVGEAEQLSRVRKSRRKDRILEQLTQQTQRKYSGRGRPAFPGKAREAINVPTVGLVQEAAVQTEAKLSWDEPVMLAGSYAAGGVHLLLLRDRLAVS